MKFKKEPKQKLLRSAIAVLIIAVVSIALFFIFKALGITDIERLRKIISNSGSLGILIFLILQILSTVLLCFVPATSMTFITLGVIMFGANWKAFLICFSGIIISSFLMDAIGRFGGSKLIIKLVGEKTYNEALELLQTKGVVYVPIMYLLPVFPDDAICMCCGALKIKWWVHYIEIILCRGIGCATIVFGVNLLPQDLMNALSPFDWAFISTHIFDYLTMLTVLAFWVIVMLFIARKIDKWLTNKWRVKK